MPTSSQHGINTSTIPANGPKRRQRHAADTPIASSTDVQTPMPM
jgi:hypothetical protein